MGTSITVAAMSGVIARAGGASASGPSSVVVNTTPRVAIRQADAADASERDPSRAILTNHAVAPGIQRPIKVSTGGNRFDAVKLRFSDDSEPTRAAGTVRRRDRIIAS